MYISVTYWEMCWYAQVRRSMTSGRSSSHQHDQADCQAAGELLALVSEQYPAGRSLRELAKQLYREPRPAVRWGA
jgi:hypothetical protein